MQTPKGVAEYAIKSPFQSYPLTSAMLGGSGLHRLERASTWIFAMNLKDARLERSIQIASLEAYAAQTSEERRKASERLKSLVAARSPEVKREIAQRRLDESEAQ